MADVVVNLEHVVRIVQAPGSNFVSVVLRDGTFVDIWEHGTDHDALMAAVGSVRVAV